MDRVRNQFEPKKSKQVLYLGRFVDEAHFRTFVYDKNGNEKIANSYTEYKNLVGSGVWFSTKAEALNKSVDGSENKGQVEVEENKTTEALEKIKSIKSKVKNSGNS